MAELTHMNENGRARMVDVSDKQTTFRLAVATGEIRIKPETVQRIKKGDMKKGDVLAVAQVAGIAAAKKTWDLIPMCHPIFITGCDMDFEVQEDRIRIKATCKTQSQTGIEMEALTAVSVAALTIYDMCKAIDKTMTIGEIKLIHKEGGRSGIYDITETK